MLPKHSPSQQSKARTQTLKWEAIWTLTSSTTMHLLEVQPGEDAQAVEATWPALDVNTRGKEVSVSSPTSNQNQNGRVQDARVSLQDQEDMPTTRTS